MLCYNSILISGIDNVWLQTSSIKSECFKQGTTKKTHKEALDMIHLIIEITFTVTLENALGAPPFTCD